MANLISVEMSGMAALQEKLTSISETRLNRAIQDGIKASASLVLGTMQENTPVDTGNLKASEEILLENLGTRAFIGPNMGKAHYAPFVEYGFHHWISGKFIPGQHYVETTAISTASAVRQIVREAVEQALK